MGVLAFSFYNAISLFWLGLMVLLMGNRRFAGTWVTGSGLLLGARFFTSHTAILGRGLAQTGFGMDFWWWVSWTPAAAAPLAWYVSMLWYTGYRPNRNHPHRAWLLVVGGLVVGVLLLLVFANPLPTYQYVAGRMILLTPSIGDFPILILVYLAYSFLCYCSRWTCCAAFPAARTAGALAPAPRPALAGGRLTGDAAGGRSCWPGRRPGL